MDINEFWENYTNKDITKISDLVINFFSQKLPDNIEEEYDLGEVIAEFTGHHETAKKYDKIEEYGIVIKHQQPQLYKKEGDYINEALVKYYCFNNDKDKLRVQVFDFLDREYDYDIFLQSFRQLLYNGFIDITNHIIKQEYTNIKESPRLIEGAEFELALAKYYIELELFVSNHSNSNTVNLLPLREILKEYDFNFDDQYFEHIAIGLAQSSKKQWQELIKEFPSDRSYVMAALEIGFLQSMKSKNCSFPTSGMIWYKLFSYFEESKANHWANYFSFEPLSFKEFINSQSSIFSDNIIDEALILWGSSYINDFLLHSQIISDIQYNNHKEIIEHFKSDFKELNEHYLWEYNFVHKWEPDLSYTLENWENEKNDFIASYDLEIKPGELDSLKFEKLFGKPFPDESINPNIKSINSTKKIGRNEKVNVKYKDGSVKNGIKYKKVMHDLNDGECELIE